ncbi:MULTISPECIES: hypothetical protein [Thermodesulfovibrio]|uniref:hypothetical protein n=1 Tax=Thermodesulfovibrio TaxID=28261 RepID=UPI00261E58D7|nr:hypothetical protein [Thermodesulfovibrio sp.]
MNRIRWDFFEKVIIPEEFSKYLWDYKIEAPLEVLILRVLRYGKFEEIERIFRLYPEETETIAFKYPEIKRGMRFWIKRWKDTFKTSIGRLYE